MKSQRAAAKAEEQGRLQREVTRRQVPSYTVGKEVLVTGDKHKSKMDHRRKSSLKQKYKTKSSK